MRDEKIIRYERPELTKYALFGVNGDPEPGESQGGDIPEDCQDPGFDDD